MALKMFYIVGSTLSAMALEANIENKLSCEMAGKVSLALKVVYTVRPLLSSMAANIGHID